MYTGFKYILTFILTALALYLAISYIPRTNLQLPASTSLANIEALYNKRWSLQDYQRFHHRLTAEKSRYDTVVYCKSLLPRENIVSLVHHKTGHDLSWQINGVLQEFCPRNIHYETALSLNKMIKNCLSRQRRHYKGCIYIHWVRHPLNTIISGFYYHLKTDEQWVHEWSIDDSVNDAVDVNINALYHDILHKNLDKHDFYSRYRKEKKFKRFHGSRKQKMEQKKQYMTPLLTCYDIGENSALYTYLGAFVHDMPENLVIHSAENVGMTLQKFYQKLQKLDYQYGLFWEFVRYFNCEWPSIYLAQRIGMEEIEEVIEYDIDDMMHKDGGFEEAMDLLLDAMHFVDNKRNRNKMSRRVKNVSIAEVREELKNELVALDIHSNKSSMHSQKSIDHLKMHVTHGSYDMEKVSHDLLTMDERVCQVIKNMTELLMFEWKHSKYC